MRNPQMSNCHLEKFQVGSFIQVIDQLPASLIPAYNVESLEDLCVSKLYKAADKLVKIYDNLEISLGSELVQFVALIDAFKKGYNIDNEPNEVFFYRILIDINGANIEYI